MVVTVLKASFDKQKPNVVNYRDYKNFRAETFRQELQTELADIDVQCLTLLGNFHPYSCAPSSRIFIHLTVFPFQVFCSQHNGS